MKKTLSPLLAEFVAATNRRDAAAYAACFAANGTVRDEGKVYRGRAAIAAWFTLVARQYHAKMEVMQFAESGGITTLTNQLSGDFKGSPVVRHFRLRVRREQIASLSISP